MSAQPDDPWLCESCGEPCDPGAELCEACREEPDPVPWPAGDSWGGDRDEYREDQP